MEIVVSIYTKPEILQGIQKSFDDIFSSIEKSDGGIFSNQLHGKWSVADNLQHLILSTYPVASALKLPKLTFKLFGKAKNGSRTYSDVYKTYKEILAKGPVTNPKYTPDENMDFDKKGMLSSWKVIGEKFQQRLENWTENDLDKYRIPHPVLGKLTFREMLFFTILHNYHHLEAIKNQQGEI
jgi:DinB superfamily